MSTMPSLWTVPETEFSTVPERDHVREACAVSGTRSDVAQMDIRASNDCQKISTSTTNSPLMPPLDESTDPQEARGMSQNIVRQILNYIPPASRYSLRTTCHSWSHAIDTAVPSIPVRPAANIVPAEILLQLFYQLSPRDFDNARRTCSQWMRVSLNEHLLETMMKRAGWWDSWLQDCQLQPPLGDGKETTAWRMSRRFATECVLSGRNINVEKTGFLSTTTVNFSELADGELDNRRPPYYSMLAGNKLYEGEAPIVPEFHVSNCGNYLQVVSDHKVYVYRLLNRTASGSFQTLFEMMEHPDITPIASIACPAEVIAVTIDTSSQTPVVAALMQNRSAVICDLDTSQSSPTSQLDSVRETQHATRPSDPEYTGHKMRPMKLTSSHYYYNICSAEDPPRTLSICPGRRCVAFGSGAGIELHWVDERYKQDLRKWFPMSQPAEVLHFLSNRPEAPTELRLISSLAGPGEQGCQCHRTSRGEKRATCPVHLLADVRSFTRWNPEDNGNLSLVRATHCHHYRAIPIDDGLHILFIEPRTSLLCIGSDAPIGGPTSLTRAFVCIPPFETDSSDAAKDRLAPTVFAVGSNWKWGLRVVAAYGDRIILYSVPLDVFNVIRKERQRQGDGVMGDSDLARDWFLDSQRSRKRRESLVQNQNGDWEFLLSVSYRPTAMMWPFKIYGKEIGRMNNVVELAIQASHGGARVWAFAASGEMNTIDVDTFTTSTQQPSDIPLKSMVIGADGSIASIKSINRNESGVLSSGPSRKRKQAELQNEFAGQHPISHRRRSFRLGTYNPSDRHGLPWATSTVVPRRTSFAACIIDFKIPELSSREGLWAQNPSECV